VIGIEGVANAQQEAEHEQREGVEHDGNVTRRRGGYCASLEPRTSPAVR
jgi:hypothetical protein